MAGLLRRSLDTAFLRATGGDPVRADELRTRAFTKFLSLIMITYVPMTAAVVVLIANRPEPVNLAAQMQQKQAVEAFATRFVDVYLKDPSNTAAIDRFYDGDVPTSALPPGGRAQRVSWSQPGVFSGGFQTWSVQVDAEIPKAANSASMVYLPLQVDISIDSGLRMRAFTLPHARSDPAPGQSVQLATQHMVSSDRPLYRTVNGFLNALLLGQGDLAPFIAAGVSLKAADPPRFTTMEIERVAANNELANAQDVPPKADRIEVTVRATMQTSTGVLMPMDYPLLMSVASGHWQVDAINNAPSILAPSQTEPTTTSTTTTTAPTYAINTPGGS